MPPTADTQKLIRPLIVFLFVFLMLLVAAPVYGAVQITESGCGGNPNLDDLPGFSDLTVARIEEGSDVASAGTYDFGNFHLTAVYSSGEWMSFDWTSTTPVAAILVKGADCWWVYEMTGADQYGGTGFTAPCCGKDADKNWYIDFTCTAPNKIHAVSHADIGFLNIPEFPYLLCGMVGILGVLGMIYYQKSKK